MISPKETRIVIFKKEWWFSVVDVSKILTAEISKATFGVTPSQLYLLKNI
jgi:hypothetical protein